MTAAASQQLLPPSVYVSRLRRAFFLRVHPDRFRSHSAKTRQEQARLVQALNDRMSWSDFLSYNYGNRSALLSPPIPPSSSSTYNKILPFVLEHRNGTLLHKTIQLDDSVENILHSMASALRDSGAASLPMPPRMASKNNYSNASDFSSTRGENDIHWAQHASSSKEQQKQHQSYHHHCNIDHRFDINTTKGRDLLQFCQSLDRSQVEERRQYRMDATSAAMMGRRLFQFQSIDGTSLHWSSKSFAMLMSSLIQLHEEHSRTRFHVQSFYPLRLVFSNHDFDVQNGRDALDLYDGVMYLNPGNTPIQWLNILQLVTPDQLTVLQQNRQRLDEAQLAIKSALGVRTKKGFTCPSADYYRFALDFAHFLRPKYEEQGGLGLVKSTSAVALESIQVVVEADEACRFRHIVTPEGHIRVGAGMSVDKVLTAIHKDSAMARKRREMDREARALSDQQARQVQWELGLTHKVYKAGIVRIGHDEFQDCMRRIVNLEPEEKGHLKMSLSGNALGVAGSGQFCHLGDDGSVVIPHDWAVKSSERTAKTSSFSGMQI